MKIVNTNNLRIVRYSLLTLFLGLNFWFASKPGSYLQYQSKYIALLAIILAVYFIEKHLIPSQIETNNINKFRIMGLQLTEKQYKLASMLIDVIGFIAVIWTLTYPIPKLLKRLL